MACREGLDPADFSPGLGDDADDPIGSELIAFSRTIADGADDDGNVVPDPATGLVYAYVVVGVDNINFSADITFAWDTADGTAVHTGSNPNYAAVAGGAGTILGGYSHTVLAVPIYRKNLAGANFTGQKTFTITLSAPVNATILTAVATVTIDYDNIDPTAVNPGAGGSPDFTPSAPSTAQEGASVLVGVFLSPASGGTTTVHYATADGTAHAGTDYTSTSGTLTFAAGDTVKNVLVPTAVGSAGKSFTFNLSAPTGGAGIAVASVTINMISGGGGGLPAQYTGWDDSDRITYDEFHTPGGGGCIYQTACTGFAGAACMSGLASHQGKGRWRFNARKLYADAGCPLCQSGGVCDTSVCVNGCNPARVPNWLASNGAQRIDKNAQNLGAGQNYTCLYQDVTADHVMFKAQASAISASTTNGLVSQMKQAIFNNGVLYMASIFYHDWNSCRGSWTTGTGANRVTGNDGYTLRQHNADHSSLAHAWCVVGWDDNHLIPANADSSFGSLRGQRVGCFRIQSSHGCDWGESGRGWIPYSYLALPSSFSGTAVRYKYWKLTWVG